MLTVARGRLNPLLPLQGLGKAGVSTAGSERRGGRPASGRLGPLQPAARGPAAGPPPRSPPQQFTCWSPASGQGPAAAALRRP